MPKNRTAAVHRSSLFVIPAIAVLCMVIIIVCVVAGLFNHLLTTKTLLIVVDEIRQAFLKLRALPSDADTLIAKVDEQYAAILAAKNEVMTGNTITFLLTIMSGIVLVIVIYVYSETHSRIKSINETIHKEQQHRNDKLMKLVELSLKNKNNIDMTITGFVVNTRYLEFFSLINDLSRVQHGDTKINIIVNAREMIRIIYDVINGIQKTQTPVCRSIFNNWRQINDNVEKTFESMSSDQQGDVQDLIYRNEQIRMLLDHNDFVAWYDSREETVNKLIEAVNDQD